MSGHAINVGDAKLNKTLPAAAAKSLQSCPTLCDPKNGCLPGSPVLEILQGGTM